MTREEANKVIRRRLEANPDLRQRYEAVMLEVLSGLELPDQDLDGVSGGQKLDAFLSGEALLQLWIF